MALESLNKITLDVSTPLNIPVVRAVQEDIRSRYVEITLVSNGEPLVLPAGVTAIVGLRRANDTYVLYDTDEDNNPAVTFVGNKATVYLRQEAVAMAGSMYTTVTLFDGTNKHLSAFAFTLKVDQTAVPSDVIIESDYINIFQNELDEINTLLNNLSATATTLPAGSDATASYSDGVFSFGIPKGETGGVSEEEFEAGMASKAPVIIDSASGDIVSVSDGAGGMYARSLVGAFSPIQAGSGNPAPDNVRPISGRTGLTVTRAGKNLIDDSKRYVSSDTLVYVGAESNGYSVPLKAGTYTISADLSAEPYSILYREENESSNTTIISPGSTERTFTIAKDGVFRFAVYRNAPSGGVDPTKIIHVQIEKGSTATPYEPYVGTSFSVSWQTEAGTVYGGTLDLISGLLTVDMAFVNTTWGALTNEATYDGYTIVRRRYDVPTAKKADVESFLAKARCNILPVNTGIASPAQGPHFVVRDTGTYIYVFMESSTASDTAIQIAWPIATPETYQLTPPTEVEMLLGVNNIFSDGGSVALEYPCDTKLFIEKLTKPTEDDMVANANIPIHKFFMIGNSLYYSTAAIAQGAAIVVGTNCNAVSLADALNQLA